jgi:hypothetical protein
MKIATGTPEDHPTPLPLDTSATPAVAPPTQRFPSGAVQGGVLADTSGVDFTGEAAAAMAAGMSADADRRGRYAASTGHHGASAGDQMVIPDVPANVVPPAESYAYPYSGMEPTAAAAGTDGIYPEPG